MGLLDIFSSLLSSTEVDLPYDVPQQPVSHIQHLVLLQKQRKLPDRHTSPVLSYKQSHQPRICSYELLAELA
jgi:hypothetical protein